MSVGILLRLCVFASLTLAVEGASVAAGSSDPAQSQNTAIGATVEQFLARLQIGDRAALDDLVTADFYAFDAGMRMSLQQLLETLANARAAGRVFTWSVASLQVRTHADSAFATWCNVGAIAEGDRAQPQRWLESAALMRTDGGWRIAFLHSTRQSPGRKLADDCPI